MSRHRLPRPLGFYMPSVHNRGQDGVQRRAQALNTGVGVCPRCGGPMTARYGRTRPYFHCLCFERGLAPP